MSDVQTKARISISRKDRQTGEYVNDFSGFVSFFGTVAAKKAASLKERDRIKLGDVDVHTYYDKIKNVTYYNFNVYSFDVQSGQNGGYNQQATAPQQAAYEGESDEELLPF